MLQRLTWLSRFQNLKFAILFAASIALFLLFLIYVTLLQFVLLWDFHVAVACWRPGDADMRRRSMRWLRGRRTARGHRVAGLGRRRAPLDRASLKFGQTAIEPSRQRDALGTRSLHPDSCVRNDVTVGPPGTVLRRTPNMSGERPALRCWGQMFSSLKPAPPLRGRSCCLRWKWRP